MRLLLLLLSAGIAYAQIDDGGALVRGQVRDARTKAAVSGATVRIFQSGGDSHLFESDARGRFQWEEAAPGAYRASVLRSGYDRIASKVVEIAAGEEEQEITLDMDRSAVVAGRVFDEDGRPMVAATVVAYRKDAHPSTLEPYWSNLYNRSGYAHSMYRGITNDRGEYRIWGLTEGEYFFFVRPAATPGPASELRLEGAPTFYPNSPTAEEATLLQLDWGDVREGTDVRVGAAARTRQTGRVTQGSEPCVRCSLTVLQKGPAASRLVAYLRTDGAGEFLIEGLTPGAYLLGASAPWKPGMRAHALREILLSTEGDRPVALNVTPPVTMRGRVVFEEPPEEIEESHESSPFPRFNYARIERRASDRDVFGSCHSETATYYGSGAERFFEVLTTPGLCRLATNGPPGSYVAGISIDGRPLERPELVVDPSGFAGDLTVRVRFDVGTVRGRIEGGTADVRVFLLPSQNNPFVDFRSAEVEPDGSFRVDAPPGSWDLIAGRSPNARPTPGLLRDLAAGKTRRIRVQVEPDEETVLREAVVLDE